ncbi:hypothetical protein [Celeribacter sp. PS-C1]|uniref:hypothetical protein n=1 Tax=Celeribacter sp. PS-C1 TaxID=2820813 RepID=UPI001CA55E59|nr:hypothetical protein [Celeribacter sp. PS-C1]MBW6418284.1 hypothetical protein [Celeribacter sp. PS-C1]
MSDPMTNLDADDVLASIRRLVAETHAQSAVKASAPSKAAEPPLTLERPLETPSEPKDVAPAPAALVLTPDFRVEKAPAVAPEEASEPLSEAPEPLVLSMEQAVHVPQADEEEAPETDLEALVAEEVHAAADAPEEPVPTAEDWSADLDDTPDEVAAAHVARLSLEQRIAELEAAVGAQGMEWEPDGSEDLEAEIPREMPRAFAEPGGRVLHFGPVETGPVETGSTKTGPEETNTADSEGDETPAEDGTDKAHEADGAAMTQSDDRADDEMDNIADAEVIEESAFQSAQDASENVAAEDEELEAPAQGVAPDFDPNFEEELALAGYADEEILDEEALREMIAQVIREELQGELGQRITRNVRSLVRREVQRALTLREFE